MTRRRLVELHGAPMDAAKPLPSRWTQGVNSRIASESTSSGSELKLAPIQTNINQQISPISLSQSPRPQRLRPNEPAYNSTNESAPLRSPSVKRQSSKIMLQQFLRRMKSTRVDGLSAVEESGSTEDTSKNTTGTPTSSTNTIPSTPISATSPVVEMNGTRNMLKTPSKTGKEKLFPTITSWDPPPLFQAYPQAVKHTCLLTPTMSADSILRVTSMRRRRSSSVRDDARNHSQHNRQSKAVDASRKKEEREKKHVRKISGSISRSEWTQKIFILVTSGYLLQYAGDGNFDRLPEKIMQLRSTSAAFASDVIPGRHWVLQISQTWDEDGKVAFGSPKSLFSRFGFHSTDSRRSTGTFLMVFTSPEEMNSWLIVLRREIEALGGKKYRSEIASDDDNAHRLQNKPSLRKLVVRDSDRPLGSLQVSESAHALPIRKQNSCQNLREHVEPTLKKPIHRRSLPARATDIPPVTISVPPKDLDFLKAHSMPSCQSENAYTSSGPHVSSSDLYLRLAQPETAEIGHTVNLKHLSVTALPNPKRRSMYAYPTRPDSKANGDLDRTRPRSVVDDIYRHSLSSPAPNFSLPSFNERFISRSPSRVQSSLCDMQNVSVSELPSSSTNFRSSLKGSEAQHSLVSETNNYIETVIAKDRRSQTHIKEPPYALDAKSTHPPSSLESRNKSNHPKRISLEPYVEISSADSFLPRKAGIVQKKPRAKGSSPQAQMMSHQDLRDPHVTSEAARCQLRRPIGMRMELGVDTGSTHSSQRADVRLHQDSPGAWMAPNPKSNRLPVSNHTMIAAAAKRKSTAMRIPQVSPRKSMPNLSLGPPVAPPPRCPLPEIPVSIASQYQPVWRANSPPSHVSAVSHRSMGPHKTHLAGPSSQVY